ncbi:carboxylesterase/lipase family protein [Oerskovia flava]|uniref:carboxylesterase/lipase family protein n=1 Tax=Oerskovia flava TaxID=2986422 RepID=UPI00223F578D|nr:carboxylesterase family protein [Oerskovia sp. JB1-3-2]
MSTEAPVVRTRSGTVRGVRRGPSSAAFCGIPFAEPPVGELRYAAPVPRAPWGGVLDATAMGSTPQRRPLAEITAIPEPSVPGDDTLRLNVFTPCPGDDAARRPVLVWFHGGGYVAGSPASPWYDGAAFNRDGVVTVSVSYRLGFDGFGWLPDAPPNRAVLDWICALEWVRDNIAAFGGDPDQVTIAGQSAGGGAVLTLLALSRAQQLFRRVVAHSAALGDVPLDAAEQTTRRLADVLGVEPVRAGFLTRTEAQVLDAQRTATAPDRATGPRDVLGRLAARSGGVLAFGPVVDGETVPLPVVESLRRGTGADKALLAGTTAEEMNDVASSLPRLLRVLPATLVLTRTGLSRRVAAQYVRDRRGLGTAGVLGQLFTDLVLRGPLTEYTAAHAGDTWVFDFRWPSPAHHGSSPHCLDLPFAWDCLAADGVERSTGPHPPQVLADEMHGAWVRFVSTGDPGWPQYAAPDFQGRVLDGRVPDDDGGVAGDLYRAERALAAR